MDTGTNHATIADRVAQLQSGMAGQLPGDVLKTFGAEQDALQAAGLPAGVAAPGGPMPDAQLLDVRGAPTTLASAVGGAPPWSCSTSGPGAPTAT